MRSRTRNYTRKIGKIANKLGTIKSNINIAAQPITSFFPSNPRLARMQAHPKTPKESDPRF